MAVQLINDMPDAEVHRGEPVRVFLRELNLPRAGKPAPSRVSGRAAILAATIALHVIAIVGFMRMKMHESAQATPAPIIASLIDAPAQTEETPPQYTPPPRC